ncbi:hypothetical protein DSL72_008713 [Monilinia vaccinii-corymbosi]|uniref:Uncharacterized protein n=1 Tax=Monilinia vaccinii-corymbosi TaxID=61207 RepID=A0A8A3PRV8_9HELO|nr:hypothetical protein DSL72_008713 [Monilinia vaccinii-corymbosi]
MRPNSEAKCDHERRVPSQGSGSISPLAQLPSPSIVAARAYASRYQNPIGWKVDAWPRSGSLTPMQQFPRRHSTIVSLAENTTSLGNKSSRTTTAPFVQILPEKRLTSECLEESGARLVAAGLKGVSSIDTFDVRRNSETPAAYSPIHRVPFQYTHDRLQTWGHAYFGNVITADAFVNAVRLRRTSLVKEQGINDSSRTSDQVTIRARVLPKAVERKPFLIQRQFNIEELRDSMPAPRPHRDHARSLTTIRRSSRLRRLSLQQIPTPNQQRAIHHHSGSHTNTDHVAVPIHIEYALHYLPVLAALMLSGHVRKGDSIDLPLPSPEEWVDTIAYVYTGQGEITSAMKENILFLAGRVESEG